MQRPPPPFQRSGASDTVLTNKIKTYMLWKEFPEKPLFSWLKGQIKLSLCLYPFFPPRMWIVCLEMDGEEILRAWGQKLLGKDGSVETQKEPWSWMASRASHRPRTACLQYPVD